MNNLLSFADPGAHKDTITGPIFKVRNTYRCSKCNKLVTRLSIKDWIKSYCEQSGTYSRLIKQR